MLLVHWNAFFVDASIPGRWNGITELLKAKYNFTFDGNLPRYFTQHRPIFAALFKSSSQLLGMKWSSFLLSALDAEPDLLGKRMLDESDLDDLEIVVHHIPMVSFGQGYLLKTKARGCSSIELQHWGRLALSEFDSAINQDPNNRGIFPFSAESDDLELLLNQASTMKLVGLTEAATLQYKILLKRSQRDPKVVLSYAHVRFSTSCCFFVLIFYF
jgi:hypothetical protein